MFWNDFAYIFKLKFLPDGALVQAVCVSHQVAAVGGGGPAADGRARSEYHGPHLRRHRGLRRVAEDGLFI